MKKFTTYQVPLNIANQADYRKFFSKKNKIIARSIFLQGLLLCNISDIPSRFSNLKETLIVFDDWVKKK